jgi:hypothetical protein
MNRQRILRVFATIVFIALLAAPVAMRYAEDAAGDADIGGVAPDALVRYGFVLEDVAEAAGVDFVHKAPVLDSKLEPIMPVVAAYGAAVSIVDVDRDGWNDLYVTTSAAGAQNALYRNVGDGTFEDVAPALGIADLNREADGASMGAVWGDYDNDGYEDLFLYRWGRPELLHNDGGTGFTRASAGLDLPDWINANTAVWFDYDADGWLDLFVGCFYRADVNLWDLPDTKVMPESFEYARNGGRNYLLRNRGDGTFEEVGLAMGIASDRWTLAAAAADVDRDGDTDLFVANDYGVNELYLNDGGQGFREVGRDANLARTPKSGMNAAFGDVMNEGAWQLYVTNISEPGVLIHGNDLWVPQHDRGEQPDYWNMAGAMGVEIAGFAFGAQFADVNNDGWLDLYVTNGYVTGQQPDSYWYDYSMVAGGHEDIIGDAANWPAMEGRSLSGNQADLLWLNDGTGRFRDVARSVGVAARYDGRSVAVADFWNRGVVDLVVASQGAPLRVYRNRVADDRHWIGFDLRGVHSNRSAIGAEVHLFWANLEHVRQVEGGNGFAAQNQRRVHFGLGTETAVDSAIVRWPSGTTQRIVAPAVDALHAVKEPE